MGNVATAFNSAFRDYNTDGVSGSGNRNPPKSDCRALGATIEANAGVIETYAAVATAALRRGNGSSASPTAIVLNDIIGAVDGIGYHSGGAFSSAARARIRYVATENWTNTAQGAQMIVSTTPTGGTSTTDSLWLGPDGSLRIRGGLGYQTGVGAGGAVTQGTSRTTGVALNAPSGKITLFTGAGSTAGQTFTLTNSFIGADDVIVLHVEGSTTPTYTFKIVAAAGSANITIFASATTSDTPVIRFAVIKGAVS